ncbi:major facilitator superfamily domain-containing protein [Lipomyces oligophaga]|uniref:major facilitator superfamily domain-containing protein n=1 Tax=Lipomyces oligophaga TaxID=45792 RepID=UPI0034CE9D4A
MSTLRERRNSLIDQESARLLGEFDERDESVIADSDGESTTGGNPDDVEAGAAAAARADQVAEQEVNELSTRGLVTLFCSLYIGVFLCALDGTVIVTLISHIASEFHELRAVSWIATSYLIALAAFQPLYGKLSDIYGRKALLLFSNSAFAIGCILCGLAPSIWFLVFARVIAGMGGGGLNSLSVITLSDLVPLRQRSLLHGIGSVCYNSGAAAGGVFGGLITDAVGWRWAFFIQVPFVLISAVAIQLNLKGKPSQEIVVETDRLKRIDFLGSFTLVTALTTFMLTLSIGGNYVEWSSPWVLILGTVSFMFVAAFVHIEKKVATEPILPVQLLKDRTILGSALSNSLIFMISYSHLFYVPIYLIAVRGVSATTAGTNIISNFIGTGIGAISTGSYMRGTGKYYWWMVSNATLLFLGCILVSTYSPATPTFLQVLFLLIPGIGFGSLITSTLIALIASVPHEFQAVTTSINYGFRALGSTMGVSMASAIFQNVLGSRLYARVTGPGAAEIIERVMDSVEEIENLPEEYKPLVISSYYDACKGVFYFAVVLGFLNIVSCAVMKEHTLHTTINRR